MTSREREALKQAVDQARRARVENASRGNRCRGCGQPTDENTNWSCQHCVGRFRGRHRREVDRLEETIRHLRVLLDERNAKVRELQGRVAFMRSVVPGGYTAPYESEEERREARRRTWRESKRRAYERRRHAA